MDDVDAFSKLYRRESESVLIFLTRRTCRRAHLRSRSELGRFISETEASIREIQQRVAYERNHPGLLPSE